MGMVSRTMRSVRALCNPFDPAARGAKIPDDDSTPSVPVTLRETFAFTPLAGGVAFINVRPYPNACIASATAITGTTITTLGAHAALSNWSALATGAGAPGDKFRIVSWGVRVWSVEAPLNRSGDFKIVTTSDGFGSGDSVGGGFFQDVEYAPCTETDICWVSHPIGVGWKEYIASAGVQAPWTHVGIFVQGATTGANTIKVEVVMNLELTMSFGQVGAVMTTPAADHDPHAITAASKVHARRKAVHLSQNTLGQTVLRLVGSAVVDGITAFAPTTAGTIKGLLTNGNAPQYMEVD